MITKCGLSNQILSSLHQIVFIFCMFLMRFSFVLSTLQKWTCLVGRFWFYCMLVVGAFRLWSFLELLASYSPIRMSCCRAPKRFIIFWAVKGSNHGCVIWSTIRYNPSNHDCVILTTIQYNRSNHDCAILSIIQYNPSNHDWVILSTSCYNPSFTCLFGKLVELWFYRLEKIATYRLLYIQFVVHGRRGGGGYCLLGRESNFQRTLVTIESMPKAL